MSTTQEKYQPVYNPDDFTPDGRLINWIPKQAAHALYAQKFKEHSVNCLWKQMCVDYMVPCTVVSCPLETYMRR